MPGLYLVFQLTFLSSLFIHHIGFAQDNSKLQPDAALCPSYAPKDGPQACVPADVARRLNGLPRPLFWTGKADLSWAKAHDPCSSSKDLDQLGREISQYSDNPVNEGATGYWASGVFIEMRSKAPGFWEARKKLVKSSFEEFVADSEIQSLCCNGNLTCVKKLKEVKLFIDEDLNSTAPLGEYDEESHTVKMSKSTLLSALYEEPIRRLVLHELGHACNYSINYASNPKNPPKIGIIETLPLEKNLLVKRFGSEFLSCLENRSQADPMFRSALGHQPASEAFAEAIFASRFKETLHWVSLKSYGGYEWSLKCLLTSPSLKRTVCGNAEYEGPQLDGGPTMESSSAH